MVEDFPDDADGNVLRDMRADGDSLTQARDIDFSLLFVELAAAKTFARVVRGRGYKVVIERWDENDSTNWDVCVVRHMVPEHGAIQAFEKELDAVAQPLGGRNDGWGCFNMQDLPPSRNGQA